MINKIKFNFLMLGTEVGIRTLSSALGNPSIIPAKGLSVLILMLLTGLEPVLFVFLLTRQVLSPLSHSSFYFSRLWQAFSISNTISSITLLSKATSPLVFDSSIRLEQIICAARSPLVKHWVSCAL